MNYYEPNRPFLISVLVPALMFYGTIGCLYGLSHLGILKGIPELNTFVLFFNDAFNGRAITNHGSLFFVSSLRLIGGIGLWSMKKWGGVIALLACGYSFYEYFNEELINQWTLLLNVGLTVVIFMHFSELE